jgi:hypothetical protein
VAGRAFKKGGIAMKAREGEIFKSFLSGAEYVVKRIENKLVVLESLNGKRQILTGIENLGIKSFYEKKEEIKS